MEETIVNGQLSVGLPSGFRVLSVSETDGMYGDGNHDRWAMADASSNHIFAVFWHSNGRLVSRLAGSKDACANAERKIAKTMKDSGYSQDGFFDRAIAGTEGHGFRCRFSINGTEYRSEVVFFMHGRVCYSVYNYTKSGEDGEVLSEVVDGLRFVD